MRLNRNLPAAKVVAASHVTTFLLSLLLGSLIVDAAPASEIVARHDVEDAGRDMGAGVAMEMDEHSHQHDPETSSSVISIPASAIASAVAPLAPPHGHDHGSHAAAKTILNDAGIHYWHHFPPSYFAADFRLDNDSAIFGEEFGEDWNPEDAHGHPALALLHVVGLFGAYFGLLPISLALRATDHPSHYLANAAFIVVAVLGWLAGATYNVETPDRYEGSLYPKIVNILLIVSLVLAGMDSIALIKRTISAHRAGTLSWSTVRTEVLASDRERWLGMGDEYEMVGSVTSVQQVESPRHSEDQPVFALGMEEEEVDLRAHSTPAERPTRPSLMRHWSPPSRSSTGSDGTLHEAPISPGSRASFHKPHGTSGAYDRSPLWARISKPTHSGLGRRLELALTWVRRSQVVFAYVTLLLGISAYTGMCRGSFVNSCAAHFVKGSIFFGYGVLTFARYLGAYADLGWAWNRRPGPARGPSAEMIECSVIFVYGITNTWMERFGAKAGDPYTVKQVQHISIAVMFWFAGLTGILLESRHVRKILGSIVGRRGEVVEPPSYVFSFNPLPALVIAVTGLAMAAHHQEYVFQVQIHSLWGNLLAGGSASRFLTYFFLWLRPPVESTLPSRPPTEVLTSFGYAAGGIVFMLSVEEISFAAMRAGYDDMMAFLNFTIALTSFIFCWVVVVMAIKGWGVMRLQKAEEEGHGERVLGALV